VDSVLDLVLDSLLDLVLDLILDSLLGLVLDLMLDSVLYSVLDLVLLNSLLLLDSLLLDSLISVYFDDSSDAEGLGGGVVDGMEVVEVMMEMRCRYKQRRQLDIC
jgi:hypothetical protein